MSPCLRRKRALTASPLLLLLLLLLLTLVLVHVGLVVPIAHVSAAQICCEEKEETFKFMELFKDVHPYVGFLFDFMGSNFCAWPAVSCPDDGTVVLDTSGYGDSAAWLNITLPEIPDTMNASRVMVSKVDATALGYIVGPMPSSLSRLVHLKTLAYRAVDFCGCLAYSWLYNDALKEAIRVTPAVQVVRLAADDCLYSNSCLDRNVRDNIGSLLRAVAQHLPWLAPTWNGENFCAYENVTCANEGPVEVEFHAASDGTGGLRMPKLEGIADQVNAEGVSFTRIAVRGFRGALEESWGPLLATAETVDLSGNEFCYCVPPSWQSDAKLLNAVKALGEQGDALLAADCASANACQDAEQRKATLEFLGLLLESIPSLQTWWAGTEYCEWKGITCSSSGTVTIDVSSSMSGESVSRLPELPETMDASAVFVDKIRIANVRGRMPASWGRLTGIGGFAFPDARFCDCIPSAWTALPALREALENLGSAVTANANPTCRSTASCLTDQQKNSTLSFLATVREALPGLSTPWQDEGNYCQWPGISCDDDGVVSVAVNSGVVSGGAGILGTLPATADPAAVMIRALNITDVALSGTLPDTWRAMPLLETINLAGTQISGSLPDAWDGGMPSLKHLLLPRSAVSGNLPAWARMQNLTHIDLRDAKLQGSLAPSWAALRQLTRVDLRGNDFCGCMPPAWTVTGVLRDAVSQLDAATQTALKAVDCAVANACPHHREESSTSPSGNGRDSSNGGKTDGTAAPGSVRVAAGPVIAITLLVSLVSML